MPDPIKQTVRSPRLVAFYSGRGTDDRGRHIDEVWTMSFEELEDVHDYIQWLFPLRERSAFQPQVPVLDDAAVTKFNTPALTARVLHSAEVMAAFYGLEIQSRTDGYSVQPSAHFESRQRTWLTRGNHNFLRLTRILKSLSILGHPALAEAWLVALTLIHEDHQSVIGNVTLQYWREALDGR